MSQHHFGWFLFAVVGALAPLTALPTQASQVRQSVPFTDELPSVVWQYTGGRD